MNMKKLYYTWSDDDMNIGLKVGILLACVAGMVLVGIII